VALHLQIYRYDAALRWIGQILLLAFLYVLTGKLGLMLAVPPATPL
jgi:hypothetical protein